MQSEKRKKPMHKRSSLCRPEEVAATILLFAFAVAGAFYLIFAPKLSFSENENRVLEQAPPLETDALLDGSFTDSLEAFVNDQFPLRTEFLSLNTSFQLLTGRKDLGSNYSAVPPEGGVYFGIMCMKCFFPIPQILSGGISRGLRPSDRRQNFLSGLCLFLLEARNSGKICLCLLRITIRKKN